MPREVGSYALSGFGVGVLAGMTGVGGGSLMTPLLVLLFGIHSLDGGWNRPLLYRRDQDRRHPRSWPEWDGTLGHCGRRLACGACQPRATGLTLLGLSYFDVHGAALSQLTTLVLAGALFLAAGALIFRQTLIALY